MKQKQGIAYCSNQLQIHRLGRSELDPCSNPNKMAKGSNHKLTWNENNRYIQNILSQILG